MSAHITAIFLLALLAAPVSWIVPRSFAFDVIALWTLAVIAAFAPVTAIWLAASTLFTLAAMHIGSRTGRKGLLAAIAAAMLVAAFVFSEFEHAYVWIGVSFFTLRLLHVLGDWWIGKLDIPTLRDLVRYQFFLPVVLVGPIHRIQNFTRQIQRRRFDWSDIFSGLERCLIGAFMAHFLGEVFWGQAYASTVARLGTGTDFLTSWLLSAIAWMKLYFVFAGLTSLALGISLMMGLRLEENFNKPWRASSLLDFWTRWHISLTNWSRDYAYTPVMALTRSPLAGVVAAMLVIGLWHALSVYYVLWSFWQALGIVVSRKAGELLPPDHLPPLARRILVSAGILGWLSLARPVINVLLGISDDAALSFF